MSVDKPVAYIKQLDGLRAVAVLLVLFDHFFIMGFYIGSTGVRLFFVISGYLITDILLRCKQAIENTEYSLGFALKRFYIRRALRIVPVFYLTLILGAAIDLPDFREGALWHATYFSNIYFVLKGQFVGLTGPYWSLAVEEQFYLLWPWLVLLIPAKRLLSFVGTLLAASVIFATTLKLFHVSSIFNTLPIFCLTPLTAGAALAIVIRRDSNFHSLYTTARRASLFGGVLLLLSGFVLFLLTNDPLCDALLEPGATLTAVWLVVHAVEGRSDWPGKLLSSRVLVTIGVLSYGIYIYHLPVKAVLLPQLEVSRSIPNFFIASFLVIGVAAISWRFFEQPINRLKRRFSYERLDLVGSSEPIPAQLQETAL